MTYPPPPGTPDPYGQPQPSQDPFAAPQQQPPAYDPYTQQPPAYGQPQQSPAAPQNPYDPYAQQSPAAPQYGQPYSPPYSQPGYGQPQQYSPYGVPTGAPKTNGLSIAALCTGIAGILLCFCYGVGIIPGILGVIFGIMGMKQTQERGENGRGLALAGLITGGVGALMSIGFWVLLAIGMNVDPASFE